MAKRKAPEVTSKEEAPPASPTSKKPAVGRKTVTSDKAAARRKSTAAAKKPTPKQETKPVAKKSVAKKPLVKKKEPEEVTKPALKKKETKEDVKPVPKKPVVKKAAAKRPAATKRVAKKKEPEEDAQPVVQKTAAKRPAAPKPGGKKGEPEKDAQPVGKKKEPKKVVKPAAKKKETEKTQPSGAGKAVAKKREVKKKEVKDKPAPSRPQKRARVVKEKEELFQPVSHPSHGQTPGVVFVMGTGDCGQLGKGEDVLEALRPLPSSVFDKEVIQVAAGGMHSMALTADGDVFTTGVNDEGALGRETGGELWEKSPLSTGLIAETEEWGKVNIPATHGRVVQLSAGDSHTVALTQQGYLYGWGTYRDSSGVYGFSPGERIALVPTLVYSPKSAADQVVKIGSGADHSVALTQGGALLTWGTGQQGALGRIGSRLPLRGAQEMQLLPQPVMFKNTNRKEETVDFACGTYTTFVLRRAKDGDRNLVFAFGLNNYGQLGVGTTENLVLAPEKLPEDVGNVVEIAAGEHHTLVRTADGKVLSWGRPTYGRLGRADVNVTSDEPVRGPEEVSLDAPNGQEVASISAGQTVSGAITTLGEVYLWGSNTMGQLGKGSDESDSITPTRLAPTNKLADKRCLQISFGGQHTLLLMTSTPPPALPSPAPVPAPATAPEPKPEAAAVGDGALVEEGVPAEEPAPAVVASKKRKAEADDEAGPSTAAAADSEQADEAAPPPVKKAKVTKAKASGTTAKSRGKTAAQPVQPEPAPAENGAGPPTDGDTVMQEVAEEEVVQEELVAAAVVEGDGDAPPPVAAEVPGNQDVEMADEGAEEVVAEANEAVEALDEALEVPPDADADADAQALPDAEVPPPGTPAEGSDGSDNEVASEAESEQDAFVA